MKPTLTDEQGVVAPPPADRLRARAERAALASALANSLGPSARRVRLVRGEMLFRRGQPAAAVFFVERGRMRLERSMEDGQQLTLASVSAGSMFAEASLFAEHYHCDAVAEVASTVASYPCVAVHAALADDSGFAVQLIARLAAQVRDLRATLEIRNLKSARGRVLAFLHTAHWQGRLPWDRPLRALAGELGLAEETLYRTVGELERQGLVVRDGRRIALSNRPKT